MIVIPDGACFLLSNETAVVEVPISGFTSLPLDDKYVFWLISGVVILDDWAGIARYCLSFL